MYANLHGKIWYLGALYTQSRKWILSLGLRTDSAVSSTIDHWPKTEVLWNKWEVFKPPFEHMITYAPLIVAVMQYR